MVPISSKSEPEDKQRTTQTEVKTELKKKDEGSAWTFRP